MQKKKNTINGIFGHFDLIKWREAKAIKGSTPYQFEELTDHYKTPLVLEGNIFKLKINFEKDIPVPQRN